MSSPTGILTDTMHKQYLASNSREIETWVHDHHVKQGHDIEMIKGGIGECAGFKDMFSGEAITIEWR